MSPKSTGCVRALQLLSWATTCSHHSRKFDGSCVLYSKFLCNIKWPAPAALTILKLLIPSALKQACAEYAHITVLRMSAHGFWQLIVVSTNVKKITWNAIWKHMNGTQLLWRNTIKTLEGCTKLMLLAQTILKYKALTISVRECLYKSSRMQESAACCDHVPSAFVPHGIHFQLSFWPAFCRRLPLLY